MHNLPPEIRYVILNNAQMRFKPSFKIQDSPSACTRFLFHTSRDSVHNGKMLMQRTLSIWNSFTYRKENFERSQNLNMIFSISQFFVRLETFTEELRGKMWCSLLKLNWIHYLSCLMYRWPAMQSCHVPLHKCSVRNLLAIWLVAQHPWILFW